MLRPPIPKDEADRLTSLRELNILDTPAEERFDRITRVAARLFDVPIALISLVDKDRQWFKSCLGVSASQTPREISFCAHAILGDEIFYIPDTLQDERFFDNPLVVDEPHIRFYAGCAVEGLDRKKVGTLCVVDRRPRELNQQELQFLRDLGGWVHVELCAMRLLELEIARGKEKVQETQSTFFEIMESLPVGVYVMDSTEKAYYANQTAQQILGKGITGNIGPDDLAEVYNAYISGTDHEYPVERMPIVRALHGKSSMIEDLEIRKPNEVLQVQVWGNPVFRNGKVAFAIAAFQDITERKCAERRLAAQHAVTRVLAESQSLIEATPRILEAICGSVGWQVGAIWLVDVESNVLRCVDVWHPAEAEVEEFETLTRKFVFPRGVGLPGRVWGSGEPFWIADIVNDPNFPRTPAAMRNGLHAAFAFPILFQGEITGVIEFFSRHVQKPDPALLTMMAALGSQIGQYIARKQAEEKLKKAEERFRLVSGGN